MKVQKDRKSITLQVDDLAATVGRITRKVDVIAPLYVGGLPAVYSSRDGVVRLGCALSHRKSRPVLCAGSCDHPESQCGVWDEGC